MLAKQCTLNTVLYWVELGRYRYLESVSVFGIFVGIFFMSVRYSVSVFWNTSVFGTVSVFLKYRLKIANFCYPTSIWHPCWGWPHRNFTVGSPFGKLKWWGHQAMKKFESKFGRFNTSTWQTDGQTDTARQQRSRYGLRHAVNIYAFSHYVVLIVCFCYTLLINDCLVWFIIEKD